MLKNLTTNKKQVNIKLMPDSGLKTSESGDLPVYNLRKSNDFSLDKDDLKRDATWKQMKQNMRSTSLE